MLRIAPFLAAGALLTAAPLSAQRPDTLRLSIQDAVARALSVSDEARLSAAQVDVADAQVAAARANALPQLRINSSYSHAYESARGQAVGSVFNQPNTYNITGSLSQTLFQGGKIVRATQAAADVRAASRLDEDEARSVLTVDVQRAYLNVLFTARVAAIQDTNVALAESRLQQTEQLERAGRAARYDVLRARVERTNLEPQAIQARNDRDLAVLELKRLLNVPIDQPLQLTSALDPQGVSAIAASQVIDTTTAPRRAAVRSAELAARSRRAGIAIARADLLPTVALAFQSGYQAFPPLGRGFPDRWGQTAAEFCNPPTAGRVCQNGGWFSDRSLQATVSIPVFDGLRTRANIDLAEAEARIADLQLAQTRETVAVDVARAQRELERSRAVFTAQQQNVGEAREAFQLASLRYSRGLSTQLEVSDAQLALLTAQTSEARATYDLYLATADLARAFGRPIPFPPTTDAAPTR